MTGSQLLAIALASAPTMITVLIGILINNARLGDLRTISTHGLIRSTNVSMKWIAASTG